MSAGHAPSRAARAPADDARSVRAGARRRGCLAGGCCPRRRGLLRRARQLVAARPRYGGRPVARARRPHRRDQPSSSPPRRRRARGVRQASGWDPSRDGRPARRRAHAHRAPPRGRGARVQEAAEAETGAPIASRSSGRSRPRRRRERRRRAARASSVPATTSSGTARRSRCTATASSRGRSTTGWAATSRSSRPAGSREAGRRARRRHRRGCREEEVGDFAGSRTAAFSIEPHVADGDRRHPRERRARRRSRDEGKVVLGGGADASRAARRSIRRLRAPLRDRRARRASRSRSRSRRAARRDRRRRRVPQPAGDRHGPRLRAAPRICTRRSRSLDLEDLERRGAAHRRLRARLEPGLELRWLNVRSVSRSVIVSAVRTPFGKLNGGLAAYPATELGAIAIRAALERIGARGE